MIAPAAFIGENLFGTILYMLMGCTGAFYIISFVTRLLKVFVLGSMYQGLAKYRMALRRNHVGEKVAKCIYMLNFASVLIIYIAVDNRQAQQAVSSYIYIYMYYIYIYKYIYI